MHVPANISLINNTTLSVRVKPSDESKQIFNVQSIEDEQRIFGLSWKVMNFSDRFLVIKVDFANPQMISLGTY